MVNCLKPHIFCAFCFHITTTYPSCTYSFCTHPTPFYHQKRREDSAEYQSNQSPIISAVMWEEGEWITFFPYQKVAGISLCSQWPNRGGWREGEYARIKNRFTLLLSTQSYSTFYVPVGLVGQLYLLVTSCIEISHAYLQWNRAQRVSQRENSITDICRLVRKNDLICCTSHFFKNVRGKRMLH